MRKKILSIVLTIAILAIIILPVFRSVSAYSRVCYNLGKTCTYCVPCVISPGVPGAEPYEGTCIGAPGISGAGSCDGYQVGPCIAGC